MTKPCAEINADLALSKGWVHGFSLSHRKQMWSSPKTRKWQTDPPDFCGDSKYTGELLEALQDYARVEVGRNNIAAYQNKGKFRCVILENGGLLGAGFGDTRIEAIARAAHAKLEAK